MRIGKRVQAGLDFVADAGGHGDDRELYSEQYGDRSVDVVRDVETGKYRARLFVGGIAQPSADQVIDSLIGAQMTASRMLNPWKR